jgi:hypothetical protein
MQECGECTMCCWLIEICAKDSPPLQHCTSCNLGKGCRDYKNRPVECKGFQCSWSLDGNAHESLRPDKCGVLFENVNENTVLGLVAPDRKIDDYIMAQIQSFQHCGSSVVLHTFKGKPIIFCTKDTKPEEVWKIIEVRRRDHDGAQLHD